MDLDDSPAAFESTSGTYKTYGPLYDVNPQQRFRRKGISPLSAWKITRRYTTGIVQPFSQANNSTAFGIAARGFLIVICVNP